MDRVSHSESNKCMENFIDLVRYVKSPIHMILCIGKEGIFVEYFPRERRIMLGHNRRSIKLPKNEFSTLLLYLDTLYDNVEEFVLGNYDDSGICIDVGYVERESNIYILDLTDLSYNTFVSMTSASERDDLDNYIDLYNTIKINNREFIKYLNNLYEGF